MRAFDWCFRDRTTGAVTIAQWPNLPLWAFLGASGMRWLLSPAEPVNSGLEIVAGTALAWWAGDEILRGVNPWRRFLGTVVLLGLIARFAAGRANP